MVDRQADSGSNDKVSTRLNFTANPDSLKRGYTCPVNGQKGKIVQNQTVKSLLAVSLRLVKEVEHFYCSSAECPVVYFSADGSSLFTVNDVREKVYHKEATKPEVLVCYCFRFSLGNLKSGSAEQRTTIISEIKQGILESQCACDLRNPEGSCCLGNVSKLVKQFNAGN